MTTTLALTIAVLAVGALLGRALWGQFVGAVPADEDSLERTRMLIETRPPAHVYRPMGRLLAEADCAFVANQSGISTAAIRRFRRLRRRIMRLYLRELRTDFEHAFRACRMLAAQTNDPVFAAAVTRQAVKFYSQLPAVYVWCHVGGFLGAPMDVGSLVRAVECLREAMKPPLAVSLAPAGLNAG